MSIFKSIQFDKFDVHTLVVVCVQLYSSLNIWWNSPVKPLGLGFACGRFVTTISISYISLVLYELIILWVIINIFKKHVSHLHSRVLWHKVNNILLFIYTYIDIISLILSFFLNFFYCSEFCHTLKWNSHGFTCVPHPNPPSHLPLHPLPLGLPSAPGPSACLMHPTWAGDLFHPR